MSFFKSVRIKAGRFIDRKRTPSPLPSSRTGSPLPPPRSDATTVEAGAAAQVAVVPPAAADPSGSSVAIQVTTPSIPLSPALSTPEPSVSQILPTLVPGAASQLTINNNNSNVNHNAPGGTIVNNNSVTQVISRDQTAEDSDTIGKALGQQHVSRALYDSQPLTAGCMEGTRVQLLESTEKLLITRGGAHIIWIAGMAGTGKTSIALTLCRRLVNVTTVLLGGTFFCSRSTGTIERTDAQRIIPTLAIALARRLPAYAQALALELKNEPDLGHKTIDVQVGRLLVKPLESAGQLERQIVFVIDALDECSDQNQLAELINVLADLTSPVPVKFLLTSRPEMHIRETSIADMSLSSIVQLHTVNESLVTSDIRVYIQKTLEKASATSTWYTGCDLDELAALSRGLFIYASTAVAYILQRRDVPGRSERLRTVMAQVSTSSLATGPLDKIYQLVLAQAADPDVCEPTEIDETRRIIAIILSTRSPLTVKALAELLQLDPAHLRGALDRIHAVIFVPEEDENGELRTLHASFGDFIFTRAPEHIRIDTSLGHKELANPCLSRMAADDLCFNISHSRSSYDPNPERKPDWIAHSLIYACLNWAHHVSLASVTSAYDDSIGLFLRVKLLFWLEVLSVMGEVGRAAGLLRIAAAAVTSSYVLRFLCDANSFVTSSHKAIERSAPHIYLSALPFAPKSSLVHRTFSPLLAGIPEIQTVGINRDGDRCVMVLAGHTDVVNSIAYSPNGRLLASGSWDRTIRLWGTRNGEETRKPLASSNGMILSIAFTSDGDRLVASTMDGFLLVWDVRTSQLLPPPLRLDSTWVYAVAASPNGSTVAAALEDSTVALCHPGANQPVGHILRGHEGAVYAVSFSSDDTMLASGGINGTIQFWDYRLGQSLGEPLRRQGGAVLSISFSRDGFHLASGLNSNEICLWDVRTRQQLHVYYGHQDAVTSVVFAPDGHTIVSGSTDSTIRLWNLHNTDPTTESVVLRGHSGFVSTVSVSNDGLYLASGSDDRTIRIWNASGACSPNVPMDGHTGIVHAIAVSGDGRLIASASGDRSARVWDAQTYQQMYPPLLGHTGPVRAVAFSFDGRWIATGSDDQTLRLWDAQTGQSATNELRGHTSSVAAIDFSPNGLHVASGSSDKTVRVWDVSTGQPTEISRIQSVGSVSSVAYSPSGAFIAFGSEHGWYQIFDVVTGEEIQKSESSKFSSTTSVAFSPDGARLVAATLNEVNVFDAQTGQHLMNLPGFTSERAVEAVTYSPDGQIIACGTRDCRVLLWRPDGKNALQSLPSGHASAITSLTFSSHGRFLITGSEDTTIRILDLDKIRSLADESDPSPLAVIELAHYEKGRFYGTTSWLVSPSGQLLLWVPPEYLGRLEIGNHSQIIAASRVVLSAEDGVLYQGEDWTKCWGARS